MAPKLSNNTQLKFGTSNNYWFVYNSSSTQWEMWTTDSDGGGTDALVLSIDDGTKNLVLGRGALSYAANSTALTPASGTANLGVHAYDSRGVRGGYQTADVQRAPTNFEGVDAWAAGSSNTTGGNVYMRSGWGSRRVAVTAASCGAQTISLSFNDCVENGTNTAGHFDCTGETNAVCATNMAACLDALTGWTASANSPTSGTVYIQYASWELTALTTPAFWFTSVPSAACATITTGNDGAFTIGATLGITPPSDQYGKTAEIQGLNLNNYTTNLADGTTVANWRTAFFGLPTINGVSGGGTETVTSGTTVYIEGQPTGSNITFTNGPYSLWVDAGTSRLDGDLVLTNQATTGLNTWFEVMTFCGQGPNATTDYISPNRADLYTSANCQAEDSTTEATADEVVWPFDVRAMSMKCGITDVANATITFALRDDTADVDGTNMACTTATGDSAGFLDCSAQDLAPNTIAANSAVAIRMTSTGNFSTGNAWCSVLVARP